MSLSKVNLLHAKKFALGVLFLSALLLSACVRSSTHNFPFDQTSQPYIPVTLAAPTQTTTAATTPTQLASDNDPDCIDNLTYIDDLTILDGTVVAPGATLDKRWLVKNSGTCNWDERYEILFTGGSEMGAVTEQSLYPARSGAEATIQLFFTAPDEPGEYRSAWTATNPDGIAFGDPIYIYIVVEAP